MAACSRSKEASSFFKIMTGDFVNNLQIPPAFVKKLVGLGRSYPQEITVRNSTNRCWIVKMNKLGNKLYFQDGWKEFVQDNSLKRGDVLVFYYHGHQEFIVRIWGKDCCEKEGGFPRKRRETDGTRMDAPQVVRLDSSSDSEDIEEISDESTESDEESQDETIRGSVKQPKKAGHVAGEQSLEAVACLRPSYVRNGRMLLPAIFKRCVKNHIHQFVKLQSSRNKTWTAKVLQNASNFLLSSGWTEFERENNFQKGDLLKFRLINEKDVTFVVSVFRNDIAV